LILEDGIFTVGLPTAAAFLMRTSMSAMGSVMLMGIPYECTDIRFRENLFWLCPTRCAGIELARPGGQAGNYIRAARPVGRPALPRSRGGYQLACRRPGTSPRMVAWRSMLRPRPNFA